MITSQAYLNDLLSYVVDDEEEEKALKDHYNVILHPDVAQQLHCPKVTADQDPTGRRQLGYESAKQGEKFSKIS